MMLSAVISLSAVALSAWTGLSWAADVPVGGSHASYEVTWATRSRLCKTLAENFNKFPESESMACERQFHPDFAQFRQPQWVELSSEDSRKIALKFTRQLLQYVSWDDYRRKVPFAEDLFRKEAEFRKLRAWEARFDFARSGTKVRVVKVTRSRCKPEDNYESYEPVIGALQDEQLDLDNRFDYLLPYRGDVFIYEGLTYFHTWSSHPRDDVGQSPSVKKTHHGYVLVYNLAWLKPGYGAHHEGGTATLAGVACQIGYRRLRP